MAKKAAPAEQQVALQPAAISSFEIPAVITELVGSGLCAVGPFVAEADRGDCGIDALIAPAPRHAFGLETNWAQST